MAWAPNPPNFYKQFTTENLTRFDELKEAQDGDTSTATQLLDLPPELRYLVPPEPPSDDGAYRLFGTNRTTRDFLATLPEMDITQLYPSSDGNEDASSDWTLDRGFYLKSLSRSIMLSFLELIGILSQNPAEAQRKQDEIKTMYLNALHLINEYRPHQARESLIMKMEDEIEAAKKEVEDVKALRQRVDTLIKDHDGLLGGMNGVLNGHANGVSGVRATEKGDEQNFSDMEVQRAIWDVLEQEFPQHRT